MAKNIVSILGFSIMLAACGGGADPVDMNESGSIEDGDSEHNSQKCDSYDFNVGEGYSVDVSMTSTYDNIVYLEQGGTDVAMNDDGGEGLNAHLTHSMAEGGSVTLHACSLTGETGPYTLTITTAAGS